ncbi:MAG: hypothetical protein JSW04_08525 [Desulfobacterales bacterium]|nr:MAG: hypothetical protein JSW04_08525 [Desulfobacterales bacterium]
MLTTVKNRLLFILLSLFVFLCCSNSNHHLPDKLADLGLAKVLQNKEATRIINKMHDKKLDDCENLIVLYGDKDSGNTLYVSIYENVEKAKTNLMQMAMKIAKGTAVFAPLTYSKMGENVHFQTQGMGFQHYLYRVDNILIWWQVVPDKAQASFTDLLNFDFKPLQDRVARQ